MWSASEIAVFDDIHHDTAPLRVEGLHPEVIEDQQVRSLDSLEFGEYGSFCFGDLQQTYQLGSSRMKDSEAILTGLIAESCGQIAFTCSGRSGNEQVFVVAHEPTHE